MKRREDKAAIGNCAKKKSIHPRRLEKVQRDADGRALLKKRRGCAAARYAASLKMASNRGR